MMCMVSKIKKRIIIMLVNTIFSGTHFYLVKRMLLNQCEGIMVGKGTRINTPIRIPAVSEVIIGDECWIGRDFAVEGNGKVTIGNRCDLAPAVTCLTGSHHIGSMERRAGKGYNGAIMIGDGTWIGSRTVILPNICIDKGNVIGAASVVTRDLTPNCVYCGVPAKKIRSLDL